MNRSKSELLGCCSPVVQWKRSWCALVVVQQSLVFCLTGPNRFPPSYQQRATATIQTWWIPDVYRLFLSEMFHLLAWYSTAQANDFLVHALWSYNKLKYIRTCGFAWWLCCTCIYNRDAWKAYSLNFCHLFLVSPRARKIPFVIRRYLPDGSHEDWRIEELIVTGI